MNTSAPPLQEIFSNHYSKWVYPEPILDLPTSFSPASGPATGSFNDLHLKSKFLAISAPRGRDCGTREMKKILLHNTLLSLIRRRPDPTEPSDLEESPAKKLDCLPKLRSVKGSISADGLDVVGSSQE